MTDSSSPPSNSPPPRRRAFFWRLFLSYAALVVLSATVIGALVLEHMAAQAVQDQTASLLGTARVLAVSEAANPAHLWSEHLPAQVAEIATESGMDLAYVLSNGRVLATSTPLPEAGAQLLALEEFAAARTQRVGTTRRDVPGTADEHLFVAAPILLEYEIIGFVRVGVPLARLTQRLAELRDRVVAGASLTALVALTVGFAFARNVTRPLERISEVCRRIAAGSLAERVDLDRPDEIGVVATTVNQMSAELRRRIDDESRERQRLAALLAALADGVVAVSGRGTIAYLNVVATRLLGIDASSALGRTFGDEVRLGAVRAIYDEALASDARVHREIRVTGHPHDQVLAVSATPVRDAEGNRRGVLIVLHDLTEIRRLEEVRREFSANVSHELKTPLAAIGSLVDALLSDEAMPARMRSRFLHKVRDQTERLQALVQDLLAIARLESALEVPEPRRVSVHELITPCLLTFTPIAEQKQVTLHVRPGGESLELHINVEAGRMVLNNLLHNAITYTPGGGTVTLTARPAGEFIALEVRDTGVGIAPEHLERIFERFYRVDQARARKDGGSGLGLAIVKHSTSAMGGRVVVESTPGTGTAFTVFLPSAAGQQEPTANLDR